MIQIIGRKDGQHKPLLTIANNAIYAHRDVPFVWQTEDGKKTRETALTAYEQEKKKKKDSKKAKEEAASSCFGPKQRPRAQGLWALGLYLP